MLNEKLRAAIDNLSKEVVANNRSGDTSTDITYVEVDGDGSVRVLTGLDMLLDAATGCEYYDDLEVRNLSDGDVHLLYDAGQISYVAVLSAKAVDELWSEAHVDCCRPLDNAEAIRYLWHKDALKTLKEVK